MVIQMRNRNITIAIVLAIMLPLRPARADEPSREYQIKAAFIYNFVQFVEWPASAFESDTSAITIGVLGDNPFGDMLQRIVAGKTVRGRPLDVQYFSRLEDLGPCHVLFVNSYDQGLLAALHDKLKDKSVLTIGEDEQFLWTGGVIRFFSDDNKVRFEINPKAAERARLNISSKLLRLAKIFTN
jgi:hypothetical protein